MVDDLPFTPNEDANRLLAAEPFAVMVGMLLDQQVPMEWAFQAPALLKEREAQDRPRVRAKDVRVGREPASRRRILEADGLMRTRRVAHDGLRELGPAKGDVAEHDWDGAAIDPPFRLNPQVVLPRHDQHAALGTRVLDRGA